MSLSINVDENGNHHGLAEVFRAIAVWLDKSEQKVGVNVTINWKTEKSK